MTIHILQTTPRRRTPLPFLLLVLCLCALPLRAQNPSGEETAAKATLSGRNVVLLGDSNVWFGGDDCRNHRGWSAWFADELQPATCRSYARSGATWSHTARTYADTAEVTEIISDDNVVLSQTYRLLAAAERGEQPRPDLIVLATGTNDAWFVRRRPDAFSVTADEAMQLDQAELLAKRPADVRGIAPAVRLNCLVLQCAFPDAKLLLLTPLQTTATTLTNIRKVGNVIEACGERMGIAVVRCDRDTPIDREREKVKKEYTIDGTHTSERGARFMGHFIATAALGLFK